MTIKRIPSIKVYSTKSYEFYEIIADQILPYSSVNFDPLQLITVDQYVLFHCIEVYSNPFQSKKVSIQLYSIPNNYSLFQSITVNYCILLSITVNYNSIPVHSSPVQSITMKQNL